MQMTCKWQLTVFVSIGWRVGTYGFGFTSGFVYANIWCIQVELKKVNTHWRDGWRFTTGQEAVITTAEALYTHVVRPSAREEKYRPQTREQEGSRHYISTAPHLPKPGPSCVWCSQLLHHLEPCLIYSLLRTSPIKPSQKYGNLVSRINTWQRVYQKPKLPVKRWNLCADKPLKTMRQKTITFPNAQSIHSMDSCRQEKLIDLSPISLNHPQA